MAASNLDLDALAREGVSFASVASGSHMVAVAAALLKVAAWPEASRLLVFLSTPRPLSSKTSGQSSSEAQQAAHPHNQADTSPVTPASAHPAIRTALCSLLAQRLEPFYAWLQPHGLRSNPMQVVLCSLTIA